MTADFAQESKCSHACLVIYVPSSSKSTWNNVAGGDRTDIVLFWAGLIICGSVLEEIVQIHFVI